MAFLLFAKEPPEWTSNDLSRALDGFERPSCMSQVNLRLSAGNPHVQEVKSSRQTRPREGGEFFWVHTRLNDVMYRI